MDAMSYSAVRANLSQTIDRVCDDHDAIIITRQKGSAAVLMSLDDYNSWQETMYLLRNPANAKHLRESIKEARAGKAKPRKLVEAKNKK